MIETILVIAIPALALLMLVEEMMGKKRSVTVGQFFLMDGKLPHWPYIGSFAATNFSLGNVIFLSLIWTAFSGIGGLFWLLVGFLFAAAVFSTASGTTRRIPPTLEIHSTRIPSRVLVSAPFSQR